MFQNFPEAGCGASGPADVENDTLKKAQESCPPSASDEGVSEICGEQCLHEKE
jgi:hypothetical protein